MKVLQVHNYYRRPSGEDAVVANEASLLREHGHEVVTYTRTNRELDDATGFAKSVRRAVGTLWSQESFSDVVKRIRDDRPDLLHVHNTFPLISPSVYWAAAQELVPVVQTLHNYRLTCANGLLMRDGQPCEACVGRFPLPAVRFRCYRASRTASTVVAGMQTAHGAVGTFRRKVHAYIALSSFAKSVMVRAGLPDDRIHVKPNFIDADPGGVEPRKRTKQVAFVGRIAYEKGLDVVLAAWRTIARPDWKLVIVGDGPERHALEPRYAALDNVEWLGWLDKHLVKDQLSRSAFAVIPSRCYEGFPMVALEAMAVGTPVIAPDFAAFPEIVRDSNAGLLFAPGNTASLRDVLQSAQLLGNPAWTALSDASRLAVSRRYGPGQNYTLLQAIYSKAVSAATRESSS